MKRSMECVLDSRVSASTAHAVDVRQDVPPGRILDEAHVAKDAREPEG